MQANCSWESLDAIKHKVFHFPISIRVVFSTKYKEKWSYGAGIRRLGHSIVNICLIRTAAYIVDYTEQTGQITAIPLYIPRYISNGLKWRQMAFKIEAFKNHPAKLMSFSLYFFKSNIKIYSKKLLWASLASFGVISIPTHVYWYNFLQI